MSKQRNEQEINKSGACPQASAAAADISKRIPELPSVGSATTSLYIIVAGEYNEPCLFDGLQLVRDDFNRGNSIPLFDQATAAQLIERATAYRAANGHTDARYRMVPVFEMTTYND